METSSHGWRVEESGSRTTPARVEVKDDLNLISIFFRPEKPTGTAFFTLAVKKPTLQSRGLIVSALKPKRRSLQFIILCLAFDDNAPLDPLFKCLSVFLSLSISLSLSVSKSPSVPL